jgi:hypothetical protein
MRVVSAVEVPSKLILDVAREGLVVVGFRVVEECLEVVPNNSVEDGFGRKTRDVLGVAIGA